MNKKDDPNQVMRSLYIDFNLWQKVKMLLTKANKPNEKQTSMSGLITLLLLDWVKQQNNQN